MFGHMLLECSCFKKEFNLGGTKLFNLNMEKLNWILFTFEPRSKSLWLSYFKGGWGAISWANQIWGGSWMHNVSLLKASGILCESWSRQYYLYRQQTPGWNMNACVDMCLCWKRQRASLHCSKNLIWQNTFIRLTSIWLHYLPSSVVGPEDPCRRGWFYPEGTHLGDSGS